MENLKHLLYLHRQTRIQQAQLAELVDALVSNTNIFGCAGSTPALGTEKPLLLMLEGVFCVSTYQSVATLAKPTIIAIIVSILFRIFKARRNTYAVKAGILRNSI